MPVEPSERPAEGIQGKDVVLDCGWGRLVFGQTFANPDDGGRRAALEADRTRDICIYLADPHVLVSRLPDELFIDPSLTYRLRARRRADQTADTRGADPPAARRRRRRGGQPDLRAATAW